MKSLTNWFPFNFLVCSNVNKCYEKHFRQEFVLLLIFHTCCCLLPYTFLPRREHVNTQGEGFCMSLVFFTAWIFQQMHKQTHTVWCYSSLKHFFSAYLKQVHGVYMARHNCLHNLHLVGCKSYTFKHRWSFPRLCGLRKCPSVPTCSDHQRQSLWGPFHLVQSKTKQDFWRAL